jgi:para-aminobenzoate synthetase/4-amino-4-deoxychorismate lyase
VPLHSALTPEQAIAWLRGEERPCALIGEWLGGLTVLGSAPARVARPDEDPFSVLDTVAATEPGDALVGGGWIGWFGYGLGARIERLPPSPPAPVVRPPFSLGFYDHVVVHDGERWWFEALWSEERDAALHERRRVWEERMRSVPAPATSAEAEVPEPFALTANGAAGHVSAVADCLRRIAAGELYQANLCTRLEARFRGDPLGLFARALAPAQPRFGAFVDGAVSLSPERFLRRVGRNVWSEPIKGTRPRTGEEAEREVAREALLRSAKDAAENVMIVDLMRNDLGRVCAYGSVEAHEPRVEPHAGVWHLVSTVSGRLRDGVGDGDLLRASFPPGSVTGAPKVQAMKVIATLEATRREVYTGAIGIISPVAGLDLSVAIRTFETVGDRIWLGVGGGIVADSDPEQELDEALDKAVGPVAAIGGRLARPQRRPLRPRFVPRNALHHGVRPDPGCGVFETVLVEQGRAVRLEAHIERLAESVRELYGVTLAPDLPARARTAAAQTAERSRLRILADADGAVDVTVSPAGTAPRAPQLLAPFALPGGLGAHKWRDRRLLEALAGVLPGRVPLLLDTDGLVLEAAYANVWIVEGDALITPLADGRILPGVTRAALLAGESPVEDMAGERELREEPIDFLRLAGAESVFLSSSISGPHPAALDAPRADRPRGPSGLAAAPP